MINVQRTSLVSVPMTKNAIPMGKLAHWHSRIRPVTKVGHWIQPIQPFVSQPGMSCASVFPSALSTKSNLLHRHARFRCMLNEYFFIRLMCDRNESRRYIVCCSHRDNCNDLDAYSAEIRRAMLPSLSEAGKAQRSTERTSKISFFSFDENAVAVERLDDYNLECDRHNDHLIGLTICSVHVWLS